MSGYLSRLAGKTGLKIGRATDTDRTAAANFPASNPASAIAPATDLIEQIVSTESSPLAPEAATAARVDESPIRTPTERRRPESTEVSRTQPADQWPPTAPATPRSNEPRATSDTHERAIGTTHLPTPVANPLEVPSPLTRQPAAREPGAGAVVQEVMAWIAAESSPASFTAASSRETTQPPSRATLPAESDTGPVSVHIGAIHLTIEAPPGRPNPPAVNPARAPVTTAPSAPPRLIGSRLRRHYLRPG